jgi:2-amino-4-hydroxy-6-hydroxymethyldihydropteridine diphosphokinase
VAILYLALGSNQGDRWALLERAFQLLGEAGIEVIAASPVYETDAVTGGHADPAQPSYLNRVLRVRTALAARAVLAVCQHSEETLGRRRDPERRDAPRTIDIDLLLYDADIIGEPGLTVPHPRMTERAFVRVPLAAVAEAGLRHPVSGVRLDEASPDLGVRQILHPGD